jgi:DNA-3-methyladenine glycosylase II
MFSPPSASPHTRARRHLARRDPVLKQLIGAVGPCTLRPGGEPFLILVRAIISQLISTRAAETIFARLAAAVSSPGVCPAAVLAVGEPALRGCGLSGAKARGLIDLATRITEGSLPLAHLPELPDDEVITHLTAVRGIGVWTAEMFLIFCLGRLDVLPVADLGLRAGVRDAYGLDDLPKPADLRARAEPWRPYRSIATWYVWRSRGGVPQSG